MFSSATCHSIWFYGRLSPFSRLFFIEPQGPDDSSRQNTHIQSPRLRKERLKRGIFHWFKGLSKVFHSAFIIEFDTMCILPDESPQHSQNIVKMALVKSIGKIIIKLFIIPMANAKPNFGVWLKPKKWKTYNRKSHAHFLSSKLSWQPTIHSARARSYAMI